MKKILISVIGLISAIFIFNQINSINNSHYSEHIPETIQFSQDRLRQLMDHFSIPGVAISIVDVNSDYIWAGGFGSDITADSIFNVASISKTFTALAVMQLVESEVIELDVPIVEYLPDFRLQSGDFENITTRMLLNHTSGIYPELLNNFGVTFERNIPEHLNEFLENLSEREMVFEAGSEFLYSNAAYNILGILVATMSGEKNYFDGFVSYLKANIFEPAGMFHSTFELTEDLSENLAEPYINSNISREMIFFNGVPAGGMFTTAADMGIFMQTILKGGAPIVETQTLDEMFRVQRPDFEPGIGEMQSGLGFFTRRSLEGRQLVGHGGNLPYYHSEMLLDRENGIGVFLTTNSSMGMMIASIVAEEILERAVTEITGEESSSVVFGDSEAVMSARSKEELQEIAGFYLLPSGQQATLRVNENGELVYIPHMSPNLHLTLTPMSDGSFRNVAQDLIFWFEGDRMYQGMGKVFIGLRVEEKPFTHIQELESFIGRYDLILENDLEAPMFSHIEVGVDELGITYVRTFAAHLSPFMPLKYDGGEWFLGGQEFLFEETDEGTSVELFGLRFLRSNFY